MIKKKICVFAFAAWMSTLSITAYGATGWVKNGETWNYYKEDGTMIKNNFTPATIRIGTAITFRLIRVDTRRTRNKVPTCFSSTLRQEILSS